MPLFRPQATYPPMLIHDAMPSLLERENIGLKLRAARKRAGLTTAQAAEVGGISVTQLGAIERGSHSLTSMSAGNLSRLPAAFGLSWEKFVEIISPVYGPYIAFIPSSPSLPVEDTYEEPEIDDALQEAVRRYGNMAEFAGIKSHNLQRALNDIDFRRRPQTPEEWLAKYLKFKDELPDGEADA